MAIAGVENNVVPEPFTGWQDYPVNLPLYDPVATSGPALNKQFHKLSERLFRGKVDTQIADIRENGGEIQCNRQVFDHADVLQAFLLHGSNTRIRIISIHQISSASRLLITRELMLQILTRYQVVPEFLDVLFSFGNDPDVADLHVTESGSSNIAVIESIDGIQHTCYQFRYAEENNRNPEIPWSVRQTGVYHQHSKDFDLFILLNPKSESTVETQLEKLQSPSQLNALTRVFQNPYHFHMLVFESYIRNWRWYLRHLGAVFEKRNERAFVFDLNHAKSVVWSFEAVQALRNLHDEVISLSAHCNGDLKVIETLKSLNPGIKERHALQPYSNLLQGYNESLIVLQNRIQNLIDLTAYALNTKTQDDAADLNELIFDLTNESVDDSATVKLITILSLFYLPGSFVGTVFGTNFFWYNSDSNRLRVGEDFWIYVVIWVGLTAVTVGAYLFLHWRKKNHSETIWRKVTSSKKEQQA